MYYLEVDSLMRVLNVVDSGLHPLLRSRAAPYAVCFQGCCNIKKYLFIQANLALKEQIGFKELYTDYPLFYTINLLLNKEHLPI